MFLAWRRGPGGRRCRPGVPDGIVLASGIDYARGARASPDDHLRTGPHSREEEAPGWRARRRGGRPARLTRILLTSAVRPPPVVGAASPDDHLRAGPDRRVLVAHCRRVRRRCGGPGVPNRIVLTAGVDVIRAATVASPDDHL